MTSKPDLKNETDEPEEIDMITTDCGGSTTPEDLQDGQRREHDDNEVDTESESVSSFETVGGVALYRHGHDSTISLQMKWLQEQAQLSMHRQNIASSTMPSDREDVEDVRSISSPSRSVGKLSPYTRKLEISHHNCQKECKPSSSSLVPTPLQSRPWWWSERQYRNWWSEQQMRQEYEEAFRGPCSNEELDLRLKRFDKHWFGQQQEEPAMYQWQMAYHNANPDEKCWCTHEEMVTGMEGRYRAFKDRYEIKLERTIHEFEAQILSSARGISKKVARVLKQYLEISKGKYEEGRYDDKRLQLPRFNHNDYLIEEELCDKLQEFHGCMREFYRSETPYWLFAFVRDCIVDLRNEDAIDLTESELVQDPRPFEP